MEGTMGAYFHARGSHLAAVVRVFAMPQMFALMILLVLCNSSFLYAQNDVRPNLAATTDDAPYVVSNELRSMLFSQGAREVQKQYIIEMYRNEEDGQQPQYDLYLTDNIHVIKSSTVLYGASDRNTTATTPRHSVHGDQSCTSHTYTGHTLHEPKQRSKNDTNCLNVRPNEPTSQGTPSRPADADRGIFHAARTAPSKSAPRIRNVTSGRAAWSAIHNSLVAASPLAPKQDVRKHASQQDQAPVSFVPHLQENHELVIKETGVYTVNFTGYVGNTINAVVQLSSHIYNTSVPRSNCEAFSLSAQLRSVPTLSTNALQTAQQTDTESSEVYGIGPAANHRALQKTAGLSKDGNVANDDTNANNDDEYDGSSWSVFWSSLSAMFDTSAFCQILPSVSMRIDRARRTQTYSVVIHASTSDAILEMTGEMEPDTEVYINDDATDEDVDKTRVVEANTLLTYRLFDFPTANEYCVLQVYIDQESESKLRTERYVFGLILPLCVLLVPIPLLFWHVDALHEFADEVDFTDWLWYPPYLMRDGIVWLTQYIATAAYTFWITRRQRYRQQRLRQQHEELIQMSHPAGFDVAHDRNGPGIGKGGGNNSNNSIGSDWEERTRRGVDYVPEGVVGSGLERRRTRISLGGGAWKAHRSSDVVIVDDTSMSEHEEDQNKKHTYAKPPKSYQDNHHAVAREGELVSDEPSLKSPLIAFAQPSSLVLLSHEQPTQRGASLSFPIRPRGGRENAVDEEHETAVRIRDERSSSAENEQQEEEEQEEEQDISLRNQSRGRAAHSANQRTSERSDSVSPSNRPLHGPTRMYHHPISNDHASARPDTLTRRHVPLTAASFSSSSSSHSLSNLSTRDRSISNTGVRRRMAKSLVAAHTHRHDAAEDHGHVALHEKNMSSMNSSTTSQGSNNHPGSLGAHVPHYSNPSRLPAVDANSSQLLRSDVITSSAERDAMLWETCPVSTGHDILFTSQPPQHHLQKTRENSECDEIERSTETVEGVSAKDVKQPAHAPSMVNAVSLAQGAANNTILSGNSTSMDHARQKSSTDHNNHKNNNEQNNREHEEDDDQEERVCRICREGVEDGPLVAPCACIGSVRWVHRHCLDHWRMESAKRNLASMNECEICKHQFNIGIRRSVMLWQGSRHIIRTGLLVITYLITIYLITTLVYGVIGRASCSASYHRVAWSNQYTLEGLCLSGLIYAMIVLVVCGGYEVVYSWWRSRPEVAEYVREMHVVPPFLTRRRTIAIALVFVVMLAQTAACGYLLKFAMYQVSQTAWSWELSPVMGGMIYMCVMGLVMQLRLWVNEFSSREPPHTNGTTSHVFPFASPGGTSAAGGSRREDAAPAVVAIQDESTDETNRETWRRSQSPAATTSNHDLAHGAAALAASHTTSVRMRSDYADRRRPVHDNIRHDYHPAERESEIDSDDSNHHNTEHTNNSNDTTTNTNNNNNNNNNSSSILAGDELDESSLSGLREVPTVAGLPRHRYGRGHRHPLRAQRDDSLGAVPSEPRLNSHFAQSRSSHHYDDSRVISMRRRGEVSPERVGHEGGELEAISSAIRSNDGANQQGSHRRHPSVDGTVSAARSGGGVGSSEVAVRSVSAPASSGSAAAPTQSSEASMFDVPPELRVIRAMEYCPPRRTFKYL